MPTLKAFEQIDAGGVDSRSNPINFPRNRALRCLNWCPKQGGWWEQRYGYATVSMSTVTASAISGMFPYRQWGGSRFTIFFQGTTFQTLNNATGVVTSPAGGTLASSAKGNAYFAHNNFFYGNGTDQVTFDGSAVRPSGLRALLPAESNNVVVTEGVRELTAAQASTITLTAAAGGSFPADQFGGHLIYVAIFDTGAAIIASPPGGTTPLQEIGPATISVGTGRISLTLNQKITVANLPNLSSVNTNWVKLIAGTQDGGATAWFFTNTNTAISADTVANNVQSNAHGLSTGDVVIIANNSLAFNGVWKVTVVDANNFTVPNSAIGTGSNTGTVSRIVQAGNAVTSVDILASTQDNSYQVNQNRGFAASTVGGSSAGYQLAVSIYNPNTGHIGNYVTIGTRALQTAYRSNWHVTGLPQIRLSNAEWALLIGRTGDGAQIPYPVIDPTGTYFTPFSNVTWLLSQGDLATQPMPTRNGIIPSQCTMFAVAGDFCYAADPASPYLRRSGDLSQAVERGNTVLGRPEQSWAGDDLDTFPTGEACTGIFEIDQEILMGTLHDCALSVNLAGIQQWNGPWNVGIAGPRAGTKCGANGFYWVTGDKQLATFVQGVPVAVSDEYELAELSQIGDSFLSTVECVYYRNPAINKEELRIECQLQSGAPYTIVHDFKLREPYSAPGSIYGQGYSSQFLGPLGTVFTSTLVRDGNGKLQVWAGASNGQIYQLYTGADDVSNQFTGDLILLINGGPERPQVPFIDFYGDQNIKITVGRNFQTSLATGAQYGFDPPSADADLPQSVPGAEQDFLYRVWLNPPEVQRLYCRFQLTSHSADGSLALNSPPHIPLESYGRLYELVPAVDGERER